MKIREIRCAGLRGATPEGGWSNELRPEDCVHTLVVVHTDEGLFGLGSVFTNDQLVQAALKVLEPLYVGENPLEPERVSEKLHQHTFWLGRGGTLTHTISGIDIALWDLLGQVVQQPIGRLLGGRYREKVTPYASVLMEDPEKLARRLDAIRRQGFRAFKIGWGPFGRKNHQTDEAIVKAVREAVGPESLLMVDAGASDAFWPNGLKWAWRTADMLSAYNITWFEEPLPPDALPDYVQLRKRARVPIAGGEVLTRRQSFQPWLEAGAFDIVQPDVTKVGGISEERRIAWMARDHGAKMIPHGWNTAVGLAADLQLSSAFPDTDLVEYLNGSPFIDGIVAEPWHLDADGMLPIPARPGLGLTLDRGAVAKYTGAEPLWDV
jgi:L-alanine-DL-glutamate epimerase-like enolase superfamily enzyme